MMSRPQVIWFGKPPSSAAFVEAKNRHLEILQHRDGEPNFDFACAAIFWATSSFLSQAVEHFEHFLTSAINHGLYVHVVVANEAAYDVLKQARDKLVGNIPARDAIHLKIDSFEYEVLERAARHCPGATANRKLSIYCQSNVKLNEEQQFLLRRAFSDCKAISLRLLTGGKSGALTFFVDATLSISTAGLRPMPYFAKLDEPRKLHDELDRYERYAEHHIAWHLRPNFPTRRTILGVTNGILVGNFVQPANSFWDHTRAGEGPKYIRALFDETLSGWRSQAEWNKLQPEDSVVSKLRHFFDPAKVPPDRVAAAGLFGTVATPTELWHRLIDLPPAQWRKSPIHGDMHGENVRVRKDDAIVIDFAKTGVGPMCADLASLEVWLSFEVPPAGESIPPREEWRSRMLDLYGPDLPEASFVAAYAQSHWIESCAREIRSIANSVCYGKDEYRTVLALYLLRHASFPAGESCEGEDEFRRTFAYWLANGIIDALTQANSQYAEVS